MEKRTVTIKDIAKAAGVSHSTVSRSLNDSPLISRETKERIRAIANSLRFEFNASARSLSTRRTGTIGIIYPELYDTLGNTLYIGLLVRVIRKELEIQGLDSIGTFPLNHYSGESNIRKLISRKKVDGFLMIAPDIPGDDWEYVRQMEVPVVILHFRPVNTDWAGLSGLFTDHEAGGFMATEALIGRGCRNILTLTEMPPGQEFGERTRGYRKALTEHGISFREEYLLKGECSYNFGYASIMGMEEPRLRKTDAIFAQADLMAFGAIEGLRTRGVRVPEDIGVIGYDDTELGGMLRPRLSSVHQPREKLASRAISLLVAIMNGTAGADPIREFVTPTLIIRDT